MALLKRVRLENFRRFEKLTIGCQKTNIFVGPNNAGKSTILDALRVCRDVHRHAYRRKPVFTNQGIHGVCPTYELFHTQLSIPIENVVRDYGDEPALIQLDFDSNQRLFIRLHPDKSVSAYFVSEKRLSGTTAEYRNRFPAEFVVVPTLSALEETEECVLDETVSKNENTRLSSRNFRNIISRKSDQDFSVFSDIIKTGWPNIEIERPTRHFSPGQGWFLTMMYKEGRIPREVYWSGFGFQIWMQMAAQMLRGGPNSILVIDEPDIYLHPDLQKKLALNAKHNFPQIFMATHSTEIINDADPADIIAIDPVKYRARRISREQDYKNIYAYLGSSENSEFIRIARAKRILFFEGNEKNLIRKFARHLALDDIFDDPYTVYLKAGGFSQWRRVKEIDWALEHIFSLTVRVGALFDRDYKCDEEVDDFCQRISGERLLVRVLARRRLRIMPFIRTR